MEELFQLLSEQQVSQKAKALFREERTTKKVLNGWFLSREVAADATEGKQLPLEEKAVVELEAVINALPLEISENAIFAGTQRDAFAASYALINPAFEVENFKGYCDPLEVYDYATPEGEVTQERINNMRARANQSEYVQELAGVYEKYGEYTGEVAFFMEQVTGHVVPDFRAALQYGLHGLIQTVHQRLAQDWLTEKQRHNLQDMERAMECAIRLAHRYADLAQEQIQQASDQRRKELELMVRTLRRVPEFGARTLYEALQSYLLLWQVMCVEQTPNPFALSVGNADRIFYPYFQKDGLTRAQAAALFKHFLVFYNVGERSWAISQNVLLSGRDLEGNDLTNDLSYAILDAYYEMNLPQPILSVKLHRNTPMRLYRELGRFFFTPGCLTPSIFNDDSLFQTLAENGVEPSDLPDYAVAGCQEPLIMGKDNGNTTNSWLNMAKVLELTLTGGKSLLTGAAIGPQSEPLKGEQLKDIRELFYQRLEWFAHQMEQAANGATQALSQLRVPFLSCFMGGLESAIDCRDTEEQGTRYNGSGCLIHGLSVVADSFVAMDHLLAEHPEEADHLVDALRQNFSGYERLHRFLDNCPKFGNHNKEADQEAVEIANRVSDLVKGLRNNWGNPFRPDWSSPSTHLLYGYWVGATPDGREAREMLGYGVDPLFGAAGNGLGFRTLSALELPYEKFNGGVASHFGVDPHYFTAPTMEEKGEQFYRRIIQPLFFNPANHRRAPFYLYVNVTTPEILRAVLAEPEKYAPSGVYIMRIHGTFVNFLDLSPAIQQDIIKRLDPKSTAC